MEKPINKKAYLPFEMDYLTDELIKKAEVELGETSERRKTALAELRTCIKEDVKLYCPMDDRYLLQFLRVRKFNVKKAMARLQNYYNMKKSAKDVTDKRDFNCFVKSCQDKLLSMMPYRDEDGAVILLIQIGNWNYREIPFADAVHCLLCTVIGCTDCHPITQICGFKIIIDVKNVTLNHILRMSPKHLHSVAKAVSVCAPARMKAIHIINESALIPYAWNIMKLLLSDKIRKRVYFHSKSAESLTSKINASLLPEEIGGTLKYDNTFWINFMKTTLEPLYDDLTQYGYRCRKNSQEQN